jgi:hypothetical protein
MQRCQGHTASLTLTSFIAMDICLNRPISLYGCVIRRSVPAPLFLRRLTVPTPPHPQQQAPV